MCVFYTIFAHLSTPLERNSPLPRDRQRPGRRRTRARPRFAGSGVLSLTSTCIHFKRCAVIAHRNDLMKVRPKERSDRTCLFGCGVKAACPLAQGGIYRVAMLGGFLCGLALADSCGLVPEPEFRFTRMVRPGSGRLHLHDADFVPPCQRKGELALGPGLADEALAHEREVSTAGSPR